MIWLLTAIAILAPGLDLLSAAGFEHLIGNRWTVALIVCLTYGFAEANHRREESSLGFGLVPRQGWLWWAKVALIIGAALAVVLGAAALSVLAISGPGVLETRGYVNESTALWRLFAWMCIDAPLTEEVIYRLALGAPLVALLGPRWTIIAGGFSFALLHALAGNQSPENLLGGFILMWAFLKSETLLVPISLHALGNACAFAFQVAWFFWHS